MSGREARWNARLMRVAVVYPGSGLPAETLERARRLCDTYFDGHERHYVETDGAGLPAAFLGMAESFPVIVLSEALAGDQPKLPASARIYQLQHNGVHVMLRLQNGAVNALDYAHLETHSFNRLGPSPQWDTLEFFPYGYIFRETGMGPPVDPFGFRIEADLEEVRRSRSSDEILVAVLGGSSVWSWYCFPDETFCALLERTLNDESVRRGSTRPVRVLNFGQGGATVLHEIQTFILHVERLRPDVVISHDGFNDAVWGMTTDPFLLRRSICAPHVFEGWSARLYGHADERLRFHHGEPVSTVNPPDPIIEAYIERKLQLDRIVRGTGAIHVPALQPFARSKASSPEEQRNVDHERYVWVWREPYRRVDLAYARMADMFDARVPDGLNFHRTFAAYGAGDTLFQDMTHTTPEGERRIADAYARYLLERGVL